MIQEKMMSGSRKERGFTLLEVVMAMFILAVALMAMAKMQTRSIEAAEYGGRMSIALRLAQDVIEEFQRNVGAAASGNDTVSITHSQGGSTAFARTWTVVDNGNWAGGAVRVVTVTVTWGARSVVLRSLLS
jgi:type IV pilus assembly protein PilV